jgi:hypothetical protein
MKLTPRKALAKLLAMFERREYIRWVAQDETEGTGEYYWRVRGDDDEGEPNIIENEEFQEMLALVKPKPTKKKRRKGDYSVRSKNKKIAIVSSKSGKVVYEQG